jgi:superfamily II DNA helicase RecQ
MIRDVFASTKSGTVVLSIAPLLSLSKDQTTKLEMKAQTSKLVSIHLDEYRSKEEVNAIVASVARVPQSTASLILFASPQVLGNKYRGLLRMLIEKKMLSMVCVDEVHLFVQFGLRFRAEFLHLKRLLFLPMVVSNNQSITVTQAPILFMTATADLVMLRQLERITGYRFQESNIFWQKKQKQKQNVCWWL